MFMFSRIQDLDRYKLDCKRFALGIQGQLNEIAAEGQELFDALQIAIEDFDNTTAGLIKKTESGAHLDHVAAQERVREAKVAMESWMLTHAPNTHVEEVMQDSAK
jgi:hypothetical protein